MLVTVGFERYVDLLLGRIKLQILEANLLDETDGWKAALKHFNDADYDKKNEILSKREKGQNTIKI